MKHEHTKMKAMGVNIRLYNSLEQAEQKKHAFIQAARIRGMDVTEQDGRYVAHVPVKKTSIKNTMAWSKYKDEKVIYRKKFQI